MTDITVYDGARPGRARDLGAAETAGIAPVPGDARYGGPARVLWPWFTGNMELSAVFLGTLAPSLGLGFWPGAAALAAGIGIGAVPVALLGTWGPRTGTAQLPLARLPFGRSVVVPGAIQWLSAGGWVAIGCYFGSQAGALLLHVPFLAAAAVVLALVAVIAVWGYELVMQTEKWVAVVMTVVFVYLTVRIFGHHVALPRTTVHGGALAGAFTVMLAAALSGSMSWASYASDYSRYLRPGSNRAGVFGCTMASMCASYGWLSLTGLAAASVLGDQTAGGVRDLAGGGAAGGLVLAAVALAAVASSALNAYSGSLALQALGVRARRPVVAAATVLLAAGAITWMYSGNLSSRFTSVLLFTGYWLAPFTAIVLIDWHRHGRAYTPAFTRDAMAWRNLGAGWRALAAFAAGFAAMVPFMDTTIWVGWASRAMDGADLAYPVGFLVAGLAYWLLRPRDRRPAAAPEQVAAVAGKA